MAKMEPIRTEADYQAALRRVSELMDAKAGDPEFHELDALVDLVEAYEDEHYPIGSPSPLGAMEFLVDQEGGIPAYLGTPAEIEGVLAGERPVTPKMAQALHEQFGIPYDVLLPEQAAIPAPVPALRNWGLAPMDAFINMITGTFPAKVRKDIIDQEATRRLAW